MKLFEVIYSIEYNTQLYKSIVISENEWQARTLCYEEVSSCMYNLKMEDFDFKTVTELDFERSCGVLSTELYD